MTTVQTTGIDTAKRVFFQRGEGEGERGRVILREKLSRERLLLFLANVPARRIALERVGSLFLQFVALLQRSAFVINNSRAALNPQLALC